MFYCVKSKPVKICSIMQPFTPFFEFFPYRRVAEINIGKH